MGVTFEGVTFEGVSFRHRRRDADALQALTLRLAPGRTVLLGPNGAGKSTLLALAVGLRKPSSGRVVRAADGVGWLPQDVRPLAGCTAHEQVAYVGWLQGMARRAAWAAAPAALASVGLDGRGGVAASELSGGQLRRVGIAAALVTAPSALLLDEPFAGLDPRERSRLREVLDQLPGDLTTVVSTHLVDEIDEAYDQVVVLDRGHLRFDGPVDGFLALAPEGPGARRAEAAYLACTSAP